MGVASGPRFPGIENGLVFAIDPLNQESWAGPDSDIVNSLVLHNPLSGSIVNDTSGSYGISSSFAFDGNDNFISVSTNTLDITTAICISSWIKTSSTSGAKTIFCQSDRSLRGNFYLGQKHNYVQLGIYHPSGTTFINTQAYGIVSDNKWYNIVGTWDGTTNTNTMKIYIDGNIAAQGTPSYTGIKNTTDRTNFPRMGATYDDAEFFDGEIGPVLVYNRALTALEVSQNYNQLKPRFT